MSKFIVKVDHIPNFTEYPISKNELWSMLEPLGLTRRYLWDGQFWYVSHEDWGRIFTDILCNMPKYTKDKFDCENFGMLVSARVSEKYKLNTCGIVVGNSPWGYHGYNMFLSDQGLFYLEPQNGEVYSVVEDSGYKAQIVIFG